ncbi:Gfo/Idh/MocA family protein [Sphingorhabdus arenilitoris]|uniref:Gfo/Idh/MocA family protein n=1 Tax=Sphingorhabdus arenilitoris TaxID=1490041 RepID=A0ABV8RBW5_9SPHN
MMRKPRVASNSENLRIGILGAARVATYAMIEAARDVGGVEVAAIASRSLTKAQEYAAAHGIARSVEGYEALIRDPDIDAVYVALPPDVHAHWSIAAAEAGKPVLCEKPFTLDPLQVEAIIAAEARTGMLIMEAQHSHYHPMAARMRDIVRGGMLGELHHIEALFEADLDESPGEHRFIEAMGGGALWDLGVYTAYWIRSMSGAEPVVLSACETRHAGGADLATSAQMQLPCGASASLSCNMQAGGVAARLIARGSNGTLTVNNPLNPQKGHSLILELNGQDAVTEQFTMRPTFSYQLEAFRDAVLHGNPVATRGEDSLKTIQLLDAIRAKARAQ